MKSDEKPRANPNVLLREEFDDWAVLFNPDTGRGFGLNPTGVYLWKIFDGTHTTEEILTSLRRDATDVPEKAGEQILAFVEELNQHDLLADVDAPFVSQSTSKTHIPTAKQKSRPDPVRYEPPKLMDFTPLSTARGGACSYGSVTATGTCTSGANTTDGYCQTGTSPHNNGCGYGSSTTGLGCISGSSASGSTYGCSTGTTDTSCSSGIFYAACSAGGGH